jgi:hypothetical protein
MKTQVILLRSEFSHEIPFLTKIAYPKKRIVHIRSYDLQLCNSGTKYILGKPLVNKYQVSSKSRALEGPGISNEKSFMTSSLYIIDTF